MSRARPMRLVEGLEWIAELPVDWDVREVGRESWVRARLGWKGLTADEYVESGGHPMLATPNIKSESIDFAGANRISEARYGESPEIMLRQDDILLTKDGSTIGTVNIVRELPEPATVNGSIAVLTAYDRLDSRFLYWSIASHYLQSLFDRVRDGMGVPHLFQRDIRRIKLPFPPAGEQRAIAAYLDRETAQIDTLIAKQEELIATLRERWTAELDATIRSDFHEVVSLRRVASVTDCAHVTADFVDDDRRYPVASIRECQGAIVDLSACRYTTSDFFDLLRASGRVPQAGDLLFVRNVSVGLVSEVTEDLPSFAMGQETVLIRPTRRMAPGYLRYALTSSQAADTIEAELIGSTFRRINVSAIRSLPVPLVEEAEQRRIVALLDERRAAIDTLIAKAERFIDLAKERRAALITAAVTGQIDVRVA